MVALPRRRQCPVRTRLQLRIEELTKVFGGGTRAYDGISIALEPREAFGLLGPNGAGKTTLVSVVVSHHVVSRRG